MHDKTLGITQLIYLQPYYLHIQNAIPTKKRRVSNNYKGKPKDENRATVAPHTTLYKPKATLDTELKRQRNWTKRVTKKKSEGVGALPW